MIRQYERRGGAIVLVEYINDDDPNKGEAVDPEEWRKEQEIKEPEKSKE